MRRIVWRPEKQYLGTTPRPKDFDAFWETRMAEADGVTLEYRFTPSQIPMYPTCAYVDLWFHGMKGAKLYARYVRPRREKPMPLVLQFHGYPGASRSWLEQSSFAGMGFAVLALGEYIGFMAATLNPYTVAVAQSIAGVELYSGLTFRAICFVVLMGISAAYLLRYAQKVRKNPELSAVYGDDCVHSFDRSQLDSYTFTWRHGLILVDVLVTLVVLVITSLRKRREDQPPAGLGTAYFRESRG